MPVCAQLPASGVYGELHPQVRSGTRRTASPAKSSQTPSSKHQNSQPVVDKASGVVYMIQDGKCAAFMMETGVQGDTID